MSLTALDQPASEIRIFGQYSEERKTPHWENIANRRRDEISRAIPSTYLIPSNLLSGNNHVDLFKKCGILTSREIHILHMSATKLLKSIHSQALTSVEVATAFCKSASLAHQATNCLAWIMFEDCLANAATLDEYMKTHGKPIGPLHGLPISVKEHIFFKGTPATSGFIAWADSFSETDALIVQVLRNAGAVFHVKTTNPQGLMALETVSNMYGTTTNPFNSALTPGGSSGGESALIAMRGSVLGIGTDIGGSIRVPSAFCGLYGLKPSVGRLPHGGLSGAHSGMENIIGCVGPMATCIEDLKLFCKVILDAQPWLVEPPLVELPWKETTSLPQSLKIGVMWNDGIVLPHPPITRCLEETVEALEKSGHTIVTWDPTLHQDLINCINEAYFLDGGAEYKEILLAGKEHPTALMNWLLSKGNPREHTVSETWKLNERRTHLQTAYAAQWNAAGIDALLCPANASVASAHGESTYWGYSSVFNMLDYSAAVFPVGAVQKGDTWEDRPKETFMSRDDEDFHRYFKGGEEKYRDAPVCLQLVTRRFNEEKLLDIVERVVDVLKSLEKGVL